MLGEAGRGSQEVVVMVCAFVPASENDISPSWASGINSHSEKVCSPQKVKCFCRMEEKEVTNY